MTTEGQTKRLSGLRPRSLRTRIAIWYGAILALCLGAYSITVGITFAGQIGDELDRRVHEDIELAARALVIDEAGKPAWAGGFLGKRIEEEEGGGHRVEVFGALQERLLSEGTLEGLSLGPPPTEASPARTVAWEAGYVRVMTEWVEIGKTRLLVRAAVSEAGVRRQIAQLVLELVLVSVSVLALGGLGGFVLVRRLLGPLARMAEHARRITAEELHGRLSPEETSTELDQLRDAFNETLARLERSFGELRRFTADASHELRTPLTALRSVGEVGLRSARTADEYREVIGTMLEEVDRLTRLAEELLALSRAEAGERRLRLEPVDLAAKAAHVVEQIRVLAEERGQTIEVGGDGPAIVSGDLLALRQAVLNLVDNAIKYSPEGSRVRVRTGKSDGAAFVEVEDEGPGIAPEHQKRIFERFYRIDSGRSREMGGTGLGLALVKWAAEAHGGRVELSSEPGKGSTFRIVLPRPARET